MADSASGYIEESVIQNKTKLETKLPVEFEIGSLRESLGPQGWLEFGITKARQDQEQVNDLNQYTQRVLDGSIEKEITERINAQETELIKMIDSLGADFFKEPSQKSLETDIDLEIAHMERMTPEEISKQINPKTGLAYTPEQWKQATEKFKRDSYVDRGAKIDPYEAAATLFFQLIDPENADAMAAAPEKLRQQRFEIYRNNKVREFEASQKVKLQRLQFASSKLGFMNDLMLDERKRIDSWNAMIFKNDQDWKQFKYQMDQNKWRDAMNTANDILNNFLKLPPEYVKENLLRYNIMAQYANSIEGRESMKVLDDETITRMFNDAKRRRTEQVLMEVKNIILPMRMKWEMYSTKPDASDLKYINQTLQAYGPLFDSNTGQDRLFTTDDLGALLAFNRPTPSTQARKDSEKNKKDINEADNKSKEKIASENNQTRKDIAAGNNAAKAGLANGKPKKETKEEKAKNDLASARKLYDTVIKQIKEVYPKFNPSNQLHFSNPKIPKDLLEQLKTVRKKIRELESIVTDKPSDGSVQLGSGSKVKFKD